MSDVLIRPAQPADCHGMQRILNAEIRAGVNVWDEAERSVAQLETWLSDRLSDGYITLVAEAEGRIAGYASYGRFRPHSGYKHTIEHSVYVDPAFRRQGIARRLLEALLKQAHADGFHVIIGGIEAENHASIRLHETLGFVETARMPEVGRKFDRWLTLVLMQRPLR